MSSKQVILPQGDGWALFRREWDGIDKPDYIHIKDVSFEEAIELVHAGTTDLFGHLQEAVNKRFPLDELAKLADDQS